MRVLSERWSRRLARYGVRWLLGLALTAAALLQVMGHIDSDPIERMDSFLSGLRMRLEKPQLDPRIVIVDIDEKSLSDIGRWPWGRDTIAHLTQQLTREYKVGAVGFDVVFAEPDTSSGYQVLEDLAGNELKDVAGLRAQLEKIRPQMDYDGLLAEALRGQPVVLGYNVSEEQKKGGLPKAAFTVDDLNGRTLDAYPSQGYEANLERLQQAATGAGIFTTMPDLDGVLRSSYLLMRIGDGYYPSLALATAATYLKAQSIKPLFFETVDELSDLELAYGGYDYVALYLDGKRQRRIPLGYGLTTTIQFRGTGGPEGGAFRYVSAADVLLGKADPAALKGNIVLIGTTAPGLNDLRATPVNHSYPGVEAHANMIKSILDGRFKLDPDFGWVIVAVQVLLAGLLLTLLLPLLAPLKSIALALGTGAAALGFNWWMYDAQDWTIDLAVILLLVAALFVLNIAYGYFFEVRKSNALVNRFGEYVAPELVAEMADDPDRYNMNGESRELSVMFVDVRGFTTISEALDPRTLREYINLYLTAMSADIRDAYRGTLDKYIGDAVMAFWGAPVAQADHAARAVATALLMQQSAARLNEDFARRGWPKLAIGIGVNTGQMHVGDMGSAIRRAYTVMGDAVNLASRLEGITKEYGVGIVVGAGTRAAAPDFLYRELDQVRVKGKNEPVAIFEPLGRASDVDMERRAEVVAWDAALAKVRAQDWDGAESALQALAASHPNDKLYGLYLQRVAYLRAHPPGPDWDGVTRFETK
jgi:adenylate cyclase